MNIDFYTLEQSGKALSHDFSRKNITDRIFMGTDYSNEQWTIKAPLFIQGTVNGMDYNVEKA